jgi:LmbE family N-acetylglucosaminyl deacetylase
MAVNMLTEAIEHAVPLVMLSPHLDDAVLSCGALMIHAARRTPVTVVTLFTEGGPPPYTLSARRYLRQVGARCAGRLYQQRRAEDRAALESVGVTCVHAGLTEALFRRRPQPRWRSPYEHLLPELGHIYPVYRVHVTSGRIAAADAGTLHDACDVIQRIMCLAPAVVLAPLGVGGHVDHVLVRTAAELSGARIVYYSDFPYNQRDRDYNAFIRRHGLVEKRWFGQAQAKAELIRAYRTQVPALFKGDRIPLVPETFFVPSDVSGGRGQPLPGGPGDLPKVRTR